MLRPSPLFVIWKKGKPRVVHNLSKQGILRAGGVDCSVNQLTDAKHDAPACDTGGVFDDLAAQVYRLRLRYPGTTLLGRKIDITDAFKQVLVDPAFAPLFSFHWGGCLFMELRLVFGWNASPGFFYDVTKKMLELLKTMRPSDFPEEVRAALGSLSEAGPIEEPLTYPVRDPPRDPAAGLGPREDADDCFSTGAVFIYDFIVVTPHREGERRAKALGMAMLWVCYQFFWLSPAGFPECVKALKFPPWGSELDILGTRWDLNQLTISLTQDKLEALKGMLSEEFPTER
jgi:hypothetical protein